MYYLQYGNKCFLIQNEQRNLWLKILFNSRLNICSEFFYWILLIIFKSNSVKLHVLFWFSIIQGRNIRMWSTRIPSRKS